jgi:biopolymer transport protein ExbD
MKPLSQINVIPFIDIMLVLLAVVLTTATFVAQGKIPVSLPQASQAEPLVPAATLEITIDSEGRAYLADKPITLEQIAEQLAAVATTTPLLLRVDGATPFRHFVAVVDLAKARGLQDLSIVARRGVGG